MRGFEPLPPAWKAVVLAVEHHTRMGPQRCGSTPGWIRTNDLPRIRRTLYRPSYGRREARSPDRGGSSARGVPRAGFEPASSADFTRELYPTELPRQMETVGLEPTILGLQSRSLTQFGHVPVLLQFPRIPPDGFEPPTRGFVDRCPSGRGIGAVGFEPTSTSLSGWSSTAELHPFHNPRWIRTTISGSRARRAAVAPGG